MRQRLEIKQVNGVADGALTIRDYTREPRNNSIAKLVFEDAAGAKTELTKAKLVDLNLLDVTTIADSTAVDVAGIVADFNTLLAALRLAKVIK